MLDIEIFSGFKGAWKLLKRRYVCFQCEVANFPLFLCFTFPFDSGFLFYLFLQLKRSLVNLMSLNFGLGSCQRRSSAFEACWNWRGFWVPWVYISALQQFLFWNILYSFIFYLCNVFCFETFRTPVFLFQKHIHNDHLSC